MSRPSTGTVAWRRDVDTGDFCWHARYTRGDKTRTNWIALDPSIGEGDVARAKASAASLVGTAKSTRKDGKGETVADYSVRWLADRVGRVASVADDRARFRLHILPILGALEARSFTRDDVERLRDDLDRKIARGDFSWKSAACVWTNVSSMCADMVNAKKRELRTRDDNPAKDVKPPDRGARKAKQFLYPDEFLKFVSCPAVPLRWRRAVSLAIYTAARDGELRDFRWDAGDIDLGHAVLNITKAYNERTRKVESTKTAETRRFTIEPNLTPLLRVMHRDARGKGLVLTWHDRHMTRSLRRWLRKAGVTRPELHTDTPTRKALTWHDLRATGLTWMAVRGDDPLKIQQRAGHSTFATTQIYIRTAESVREGFGTPFPPLPSFVIEASVTEPESPSSQKQGDSSSGCWTRTSDPAVNSRLLYQLS